MKLTKPAQGHTYYQKGNTMPHAHTPGTWYTSDKGPSSPHYQGQVAVEETGRTIAITYDDEGGYNARLIAAAPSLKEAAHMALQALRHAPLEGPYGKDAKRALEVALAQAEGTKL